MKIRDFALLALFIALVAVSTIIIQIPIPQTKGYVNLGDSIVLIAAVTFGPIGGFIAGGIGSALADLFGGYPHWAPWTLIIKGVEALIAALMFILFRAKKNAISIKQIVIFIMATAWMVFGYFIAGTIMFDQKAALVELPQNILQASGSVVLASLLLPLFHRIISTTRD